MVGVEGEHSKPLVPAEKETEPGFNLIVCLQGERQNTIVNVRGVSVKRWEKNLPSGATDRKTRAL